MIKSLTNQFNYLKYFTFIIGVFFAAVGNAQSIKKVMNKIDDFQIIEAEKFDNQSLDSKRKWHLVTSKKTPKVRKDHDPNHSKGASGNAYLEVLPDTHYNDKTKKIVGKNYSRIGGELGVVSYNVNFESTGKYYVWVRGYGASVHDNSIHVGIDGKWPKSSLGLYICENNLNKWAWSSSQFINEENCRSKKRIFFNIKKPGIHKVMFSMREDGFEFDKFAITKQENKKPK